MTKVNCRQNWTYKKTKKKKKGKGFVKGLPKHHYRENEDKIIENENNTQIHRK